MVMADATASATGAPSIERDCLEQAYSPVMAEEPRLGHLVSYVGNRSVPLLRLYRYKEAFAFEFVREFIHRFELSASDYVLDPFAGMGTTLLACWSRGVISAGIDRLPIAAFVANSLLKMALLQPGDLKAAWRRMARRVDTMALAPVALDVPIMRRAFDEKTLTRLRQWKSATEELDDRVREPALLLLLSVLEAVSYSSKDGQFLRLKPDKAIADPDRELRRKFEEAERDLLVLRHGMMGDIGNGANEPPTVFLADTRTSEGIRLERPVTGIITSPPYVNRYDYTRSYCLELCFHFVRDFAELRSIRHGVLRSHIESRASADDEPPHPAVSELLRALESRELNNPRIPCMLLGYFVDMGKAIWQWAEWLAPGARVALVVDNVRFEGEHVPVDLILSDMAAMTHFEVERILITRRKGNSSQQMGKYGRIPVRESVVVWRRR
jgi:hypothetical protein